MGSRWKNIRKAVNESISIAETLRKMELDPRGANYRKFKKLVKEQNINTSHFKGQKQGTVQKKIPWTEILVENSKHEINDRRKKRLIKEGVLINLCSICGISTWQGKSIVLHLDHINGNHHDNRIENLRLICPNCHSQTNTYCGKNKKTEPRKFFCICGSEKSRASKVCLKCEHKRRAKYSKIIWPKIDVLIKLLETKNYVQIGNELGVSDNAVRKHIKNYLTHQL